MEKLTASNLASFINQLNKKTNYGYVNPKNKGLIKIVNVERPEGPISIKRFDINKGETEKNAKVETISSQMLWRLANAFTPGYPINVDRILGASYNTRSVLESLLIHTPMFYFCYPGRIEEIGSTLRVKKGHKHIMWQPENPHEPGIAMLAETDIEISEVPNLEVFYDVIKFANKEYTIDIEVQRRHAQIQIALYHIGKQLNYKIWIANNDKGIVYNKKRLEEYEGVMSSLDSDNAIQHRQNAIKAALLIDCIWFENGELMPAVMEVEHSTGVTSGLTRMKGLQDELPQYFPSRYVIVASDNDRSKVIQECTRPQFKSLNARYFSYSAVEELYALCQKRKIRGVTEQFLDCYMIPVSEL